EMMQSMILPMLVGAASIYGPGMRDAGITFDMSALVMGDEVLGSVRRLYRGVPTSVDDLCVDLINAVGPCGEFVSSEHTFKHMREHILPELAYRGSHDNWLAAGQPNMVNRAEDKVIEILETSPKYTNPRADKIREFIERIEKEQGIIK
ncbi:MAG: trimethylamine methyltransferase family protein, partial [Bacillota bacterium]|nr:trimethylamine methyltransferase family protein [Bacillota bacterium]